MSFFETLLPNGLRVIYQERPGLPLSAGTLLIPGGCAGESSEKAGVCGMTFELLSQGTRRRNATRFAKDLEKIGTFFGTQSSDDYADLGFIAPAAQLRPALALAAEALTEPSFTPSEFEKEKRHVLSALATRHDTIFNVAHDRLMERLYPNHPYGRVVDGTPKTVSAMTRTDVRRWHQTRVAPHGAVLSIVSPLSWRTVAGWVKSSFGRWRSEATAAPNTVAMPAPLERSVDETIQKKFEQSYLMLGIQAPAANAPDVMALKALNSVLGGGMSSRLFVQLREKEGLAYEVSCYYPTRVQTSQWVVYMGCAPERLPRARTRLLELLEELADKGVTDAELRQAKAMMKGSFAMDHQSRRRVAWYGAWWTFLGRGAGYDHEFPKAVDRVTRAEVKRVASRLLAQPRVLVQVHP